MGLLLLRPGYSMCWRFPCVAYLACTCICCACTTANQAPASHPLLPQQRALLRTAQEIAKGMGYIHEFNIGGCHCGGPAACRCVWHLLRATGSKASLP